MIWPLSLIPECLIFCIYNDDIKSNYPDRFKLIIYVEEEEKEEGQVLLINLWSWHR